MPEGNTIHWLARTHNRDLGGKRVRVSSPQGRFAREARRLDGREFLRAEAYGKHLFHHWEGGAVVHVHLGMAGWFYRYAGRPPAPRPSVRMRLAAPAVTVDLIGPPTCALGSAADRDAVVARLGPDPLDPASDPTRGFERLARRRTPIGDALLDQRVAAGVGNIYRCEALFLAGIHPLRPSRRIREDDWREIWRILRELMRRGARAGRISTVDPRETPHPGSLRGPRDAFYVYQREVCRRCGSPLKEFPLSGRRMWACPVDQPRRPPRRGSNARPLSRHPER
jgi:endonuclease-8